MAKKVGALVHSGQLEAAHERVGEFTLGEIRRGFLVGIAVHKLLSPPRPTVPKPSGTTTSRPKPSGPAPSGPTPSGPQPSGPATSGPQPSGSPPSSGSLEKRATFLEEESYLDRLA